jgi:hypothetical protein
MTMLKGMLMEKSAARIGARLLVGLLVFLCAFFTGSKSVQAFDPQQYTVQSITIFKIYNAERQLEQRRVLITGQYLKDATVGIITSSGYQELKDRINNSEGLLQFNINQDQTGSYLVIEGQTIAVNEGAMPSLTGIGRKVRVGIDDLSLTGTNLKAVRDSIPDITAGYEHEGAYTPIDESFFINDSLVTITKPSGALGLQNLIFEKTETASYAFGSGVPSPVIINIKYTYRDQFRFVQDLAVQGLEMYPNRGEAGSKLFFQAPHPQLNSYDVFFLKNIDGTDPYTNANKGQNRTFQSNINQMDILTVEIPNLPVGEYYVILTNPVAPGYDPMSQVVQELIVGSPLYQKFTIIDANIKSAILNIQPAYGPDTGSRVTITGQFFGTLNIPEYVPDNNTISTPVPPVNCKELLLDYAPGTYRGVEIKKAQRKLKVVIGDQATFIPKADNSGYELSFHTDLDVITVMSAQVADAMTDPRKDVVVETETTLTRRDDSTVVFRERAALSKGYTYIPSKIVPQILSMSPDKIQVSSSAGHYVVPEDRMAAITGSNFAVTRFINAAGEEIVRFPIIELGPELILDKNSRPDLYLRVFDKNGREVDGTESNELGSRILFIIPGNSAVNTLGTNYLKVINPIKNSINPGLSALRNDFISFVNPESNRLPIITAVNPDVTTVEGGETINIEGSNFMTGVKVFIDGSEIGQIRRQEDGKKITLVAPAGREGKTQLQVMNPEGGMDTRPFTYVLTYTNPKITSFAPKSGNTGTLVLVRGENFLKPEPAAKEINPLKLIGTRILLEGQEINQYNRDPGSGKIELRDYTNDGQPLLSIVNRSGSGAYLDVADYYQAVVLQAADGSGDIYTLDKDYRGDIILSNGADRTYTLELGKDERILAILSNGVAAPLTVTASGLNVATSPPLNLNMKTLYKVDSSNHITGKRVNVMDSQTLLFTVPILDADGYYDLTVVNPDTKRDSRIDQMGFYYYKLPLSRPVITSIEPNQGSTQGGYSIDIKGQEFEDNGSTKVKVFINGIEISAMDTVVSSKGDMITVKVPAYPGDLRQEKATDHLTVPVVVVNPDGGSAGIEQGFTYIVPSSHPRITALLPARGSGAGVQVVEIIGTDFRYFEPYDDANRNQIWDPNESFSDINLNNRWDSEADFDDPETDWREAIAIDHNQYDYYYDSPVLPRVFFGRQTAQIVEFARGYIKVLAPAHGAGVVDVYLVNNDAGISNTMRYTFEGSSPKITRIIPNEGPKQGRQYVEIFGSGFANSPVPVWQNGTVNTISMPLIRFGNIDNRSIPRGQPNAGRIDNGFATVRLEGGLTVEYRAVGELKLTVEERGQFFEMSCAYDDSRRFFVMSELCLRGDDSTAYGGNELLKVSIEERRLIVERGYAPQAQIFLSDQLTVETPSYYTVGIVPVRIYNPDGGQASGKYEYKNPDSHPRIINITRDGKEPQEITIDGKTSRILKVNYRAQAVVSILGEDFREGARIQVGDLFSVEPKDIRYELPGKLAFVMPGITEKSIGALHRVVVINSDGGTAASDQIPGSMSIYIQFTSGETSPSITSVSPAFGPASGGTVVTILGADFRRGIDGYKDPLGVYFGAIKVADTDVQLLDYKTCQVISAPGSPGPVDVKLENPDGVLAHYNAGYTYISTPAISAVLDPADADEKSSITEISVLGGQQIKIKGSGFLPGAQVIFNPVLAETGSAARGNPLYRTVERVVAGRNSQESEPFYLQSGAAGSAVTVLSEDTLLVTTPSGQIGSSGLLVCNPDGGASPIFSLSYDLPELPAPNQVAAEIIHDRYTDYDRYIKVHWDPVAGATQYETHVIIDRQKEYIGSTPLTTFVYPNLKANTSYQFVVTAVGNFGSSPPSMKSNRVRTGARAGVPDSDGKPGEQSSMTRSGDTVYYTIGAEDTGNSWLLDLTQGELAGAQEVVVAIPAVLIARNSNSALRIKSLEYEVIINPAVFNSESVRAYAHRDDAGVRFRIAPAAGQTGLVPGNSLSTPYAFEAQFYQGLNHNSLDYLAGNFSMSLSYDQLKAQLRRLNQVQPYRFDLYQGKWVPLPGAYAAGGWHSVNRLGIYSIIGNRG